MDVWRITVAALRRWYVLLPLLGLTALLVMAVGRGVQPEYDVTGATMLVPGQELQDVPNPYGGTTEANAAVGIVLNSPAVRQQVADMGLVAGYEVSPQSRSTVMNFQVRSDTPGAGVETGVAVFRLAAEELRDRQSAAGIRTGQQYTIDVLQAPSVSAAVTDGKLRNMAVVGVLGGAVSLAIAVFFDDVVGLLKRRRRRRREAEAGSPGPAEDASADSDAAPVDQPTATDEAAATKSAGASAGNEDAVTRHPRRLKKPKRSPRATGATDSGGSDVPAATSRSMAVSDAR